MPPGPTMESTHYDKLTKILHWFSAVVIIYAMIMGYSLHWLVGTPYFKIISELNMSMATLIMPVIVFRFIWRFFRPRLPYPSHMSGAAKSVAIMMHEIFYLVILFTLISGFLMLEYGFNLFGLIWINQPIISLEINRFFFMAHRYSCIALASLLLAHVGAVIKHSLAGHHDIIKRML